MIELTGKQYDPLKAHEVQELWEAAHLGDQKARERLICSTLRPVVSECYRYAAAYDLDELISMALFVAVEAFDNYDPDKGMQFYVFVVWCVRCRIGELIRRSRLTVHTDDERLLVSLGGFEETADHDIEAYRSNRNKTITEYMLTLPTITPHTLQEMLSYVEANGRLPRGMRKRLNGAARPTPQIVKAIEELMGADTAAKAVATYEGRATRSKMYKERQRERRRNPQREAERARRRELKAQREAERKAAAELKALKLQRMKERKAIEKQQAVDNFNMLYQFIVENTDSTPMQAEAGAYLTLKGYDTLRAWSDRHNLVYETVKRWRMDVRRKLTDHENVDKAIAKLDPTLFKT